MSSIYILLTFALLTCSSSSGIEKQSVTGNIIQKPTLGIFKVNGVGYQGPSQVEVNNLPEFIVNAGENVTQNINTAINNASKSNINGKKGGRVIINAGTYVVGALNLKSNVHILLKTGVTLVADQTDVSKKNRAKAVFVIGREKTLKNISIIGEDNGSDKPKIEYKRESERGLGGTRSFLVCSVTNLFIQNIAIHDDQTRFSGVVFTFKKDDISENGRAKNVTVDNVEQIDASYGYGLIQANTGANLLLTNLKCSGGVTARIETDNRYNRNIRVGVSNIRIKNVTNSRGKAAVFFHPHDLQNGKVTVDGAHAYGSQAAIDIMPGINGGQFLPNISIKNVSAEYTLETTVHFAGKKFIPKCLLSYFKQNESDIDKERKGAKKGPSIYVIGNYTNYADIDESTVFASVPNNTPDANKISSRKTIVTTTAYRGANPNKQCGDNAY